MRNVALLRHPVLILACLLCMLQTPLTADGYLYIIGGGKRPLYMMEEIAALAGGPDARILIIPNASGDPRGTAEFQKNQLISAGAGSVDFLLFDRRTVDHDSTLAQLRNATGVFFSGGNQSRLTRDLQDTRLLDRIFEIYHQGGVIAGTSAGAAVMSSIMITGDELLNSDSTDAFSMIRKGNIVTVPGFGFLKSAIVDQHFIKRKRINRLISLILENPGLTGVGIDESTAIVVHPENIFRVAGENSVMVIDASEAENIRTDPNLNLSAGHIILHLLHTGQKYDLKSRQIIP